MTLDEWVNGAVCFSPATSELDFYIFILKWIYETTHFNKIFDCHLNRQCHGEFC